MVMIYDFYVCFQSQLELPQDLPPAYITPPASPPHQLPYSLLLSCDGTAGSSSAMPVTTRACVLQLRFTLLEGKCSLGLGQLSELRHFYCLQAAEVEGERQQALAASTVWDETSITAYYDHIHHQLIDRVERSLGLVEAKIASNCCYPPTSADACRGLSPPATPPSDGGLSPPTTPPACDSGPSPPARKCTRPAFPRPSIIKPLNQVATSIMTNWYNHHAEHPYPSYDAAEVMAKAGSISVEQVKKWFANKRRRAGNTKTLTEVAHRRKRVRTESSCDFMLGGAKRAR